MADIQIVQENNLSPERARAAAQQVADKVAAEFGMQWRWDGDVLRFERSGVEGALTLADALSERARAAGLDFMVAEVELRRLRTLQNAGRIAEARKAAERATAADVAATTTTR